MTKLKGFKVNIKRVLVLDKDELVCKSIVNLMSDRAEEIRVCHTVEHVRDIILKWIPRLLIIEMKLLDVNSINFLREMQLKSSAMSIVAMIENAKDISRFIIGYLGVLSYLQKPFGLQELNVAIDKAISISLVPKTIGKIPIFHIDINEISKQIYSAICLVEDDIPDIKLWQIKKK